MGPLSLGIRIASALKPHARRTDSNNPALIHRRLASTVRRRITDEIGNLVRRACQTGHNELAADLLGVLRNQVAREKQEFPDGRRPAEEALRDLATEIESTYLPARRALRG